MFCILRNITFLTGLRTGANHDVAKMRHQFKDIDDAIQSWKGFFNSRKRLRQNAQKVCLTVLKCLTFHKLFFFQKKWKDLILVGRESVWARVAFTFYLACELPVTKALAEHKPWPLDEADAQMLLDHDWTHVRHKVIKRGMMSAVEFDQAVLCYVLRR